MTAAVPARVALRDRGFWIHFGQMVIAMVLGMVLGMAALAPLHPMSWSFEAHTLAMATGMAVGMAAWMLLRRHGWAATAEMVAAMYLPFLLLFPAYWLGWLTGSAVFLLGHALMLPAMVVLMLRRPAEYVGRRP